MLSPRGKGSNSQISGSFHKSVFGGVAVKIWENFKVVS